MDGCGWNDDQHWYGLSQFLSVSYIVITCLSVVLTLKEQLWGWLSLGPFAQVTRLE